MELEKRLHEQWTAQLSIMALNGTYMSFEEYKSRMTGAYIDKRPTSEILKELEEVDRQFEERKDGTRDF